MAAWGGLGAACLREERPGGMPGGARGGSRVHLAADAPWTKSTDGVRLRRGQSREREEEGRDLFVISKSLGTS